MLVNGERADSSLAGAEGKSGVCERQFGSL